MTLLYVTEFSTLYTDALGGSMILKTPVVTNQAPVSVGVGSLQSAAFNNGTRMVRLNLDVNGSVGASIAFGANPTALANSGMRLAPNQTEYFAVNPGDKVAVIVDTV